MKYRLIMAAFCYILAVLFTSVVVAERRKWCDDVSIPPHSMLYMAGDSSYYTVHCHRGYSISGRSYVRCIDGKWETLPPKCVENSTNVCAELQTPENGKMECSKGPLYVNAACRFKCDEGYRISGVNLRRCLYNFQWSGKQPKCIDDTKNVCQEPPAPENGKVLCNKGPLLPSAGCYFSCDEGYSISGLTSRRCLTNLKWSGQQPKCIADTPNVCPELTTPENGRKECDEGPLYANAVCRFGCNEGYRISGGNSRICLFNHKWSANEPTCIEEKQPQPPDEGRSYVQSYPGSYSNSPSSYPVRQAEPKLPTYHQPGYYEVRLTEKHSTEGLNPLKINPTHERTGESNRNYPSGWDPCQNNGGCQHTCSFRLGAKQCSCYKGLDLAPDGISCIEKTSDHFETSKFDEEHVLPYPKTNLQPLESYPVLNPEPLPPSPYRQPNPPGSHISPPRSNPSGRQEVPGRNDAADYSRINPCYRNRGGCQHNCNFENGKVRCSCVKGYKIAEDGKTCIVNNTGLIYNVRPPSVSYPTTHSCPVDWCEHICIITRNRNRPYRCSCNKGYHLDRDNRHCIDINECAHETLNRCQHKCVNHEGGYSCFCNDGYRLIDKFKCEGCKKNSYWLPEEERCAKCPENSFTDSDGKTSIKDCRCLPGYIGTPEENVPCEDIDECAVENFGCSHKCVNTPGDVFCSCPIGFTLDLDNKTCIDIDECSIKNGGCEGICHNTNGSFHCRCPPGFVPSNRDHYSCDDVDECLENNGGCSQNCNNYRGGFYCSCEEGFRLDSGLHNCTDIRCPARPPPHHATDRCKINGERIPLLDSYSIGTICIYNCNPGFKNKATSKKIECLPDGTWKGSLPICEPQFCEPLPVPANGEVHPPSCARRGNSVKQRCTFTCRPGYVFKGKTIFTCQNSLKWSNSEIPECKPVTTEPFIKCPEDISVDLLPGENIHNITVPQPTTNVKTFNIHPDWVSMDRPVQFPAGITQVFFNATDSDFSSFPECSTSIHVIDKEAPVFNFCPESLEMSGAGLGGVKAAWEEPIASDNVGIESLISTLDRNSILSIGTYLVDYVAKDFAGNTAKCSFGINITRTHCRNLDDPANGVTDCMEWVVGKVCQPVCNPGYAQHPSQPILYSCDESGNWEPSDVVADCLRYIPATSSSCPPDYDLSEHEETEDEICIQRPDDTV